MDNPDSIAHKAPTMENSMRFIPTVEVQVEQFKLSAQKMRRSKPYSRAEALRRIANQNGYDHWNHVTWCLKETYRRIENGEPIGEAFVFPDETSFTERVDYFANLAKGGACGIGCTRSMFMFATSDGDAWLLDVETNQCVCLCWHGTRQNYRIFETERTISVEYDAHYLIDGQLFSVSSDNPVIGDRAIGLSYPTDVIAEFSIMVGEHSK